MTIDHRMHQAFVSQLLAVVQYQINESDGTNRFVAAHLSLKWNAKHEVLGIK
jgi:hypothetical protein